MGKFSEILRFIINKNLVALLIFLIVTFAAVYFCFVAEKNVVNIYKDALDIKASNETTVEEIKKLQEKLKRQQNAKKAEKIQEEKVPIIVYRPMRQNAPIESSAVDLVTEVIKSLERTQNSIMDISYSIVDTQQAGVPTNISIVKLYMTLNGSYISFQDFLFDLYDDQYVATIKQTKMTPLQENKSILEIDTEIWLYIAK